MKPSEEFKTLLEVLPSNLQAKCNVFLDSVTGINSDLSLYVKTIYIGVELDGAMVAALYPLKDSLEVVLALDSSHENSKLKDATHLTWRTMPVLFKVEKVSDFKSLNSLFIEAIEGVVSGRHDVERPAAFFRGRVSRLSHDPQTGKKIW